MKKRTLFSILSFKFAKICLQETLFELWCCQNTETNDWWVCCYFFKYSLIFSIWVFKAHSVTCWLIFSQNIFYKFKSLSENLFVFKLTTLQVQQVQKNKHFLYPIYVQSYQKLFKSSKDTVYNKNTHSEKHRI